jgi:hypothetical protein
MTQEAYCSFETARLLKEKGFDEPFKDYHYDKEGNRIGYLTPKETYPCPTHQMAMAWLREVYKLSIEPYSIAIEENCIGYAYAICSCKTGLEIFAERWDGKNPFVSYEEAVEAGLKYSLENLI